MMFDDIENFSYDFKSNEITQNVILDDIAHLTITINDILEKLRRNEFLAIYTTKELVKNLLFIAVSDDLKTLEKCFDSNEEYYIMTFAWDGNIIIEPMFIDGIMTESEATLTMLDGLCPTRVLLKHQFNEENLLIFDFEEEI